MGPQCTARAGRPRHAPGPALVLDRGLVGGIHLDRVVAAEPHFVDLLVGHVRDELGGVGMASEEVLARLEEMIQSPRYQPGDQLPSERQLMKRFGVGRTAVREALYSLQKMGLLEIKSGKRGRVTKPTPRILLNELRGAARHLLAEPEGERHFQEARTFFEVGLVRHAAQHASPADLEELRAALDANKAALGDLEPVGGD